MHLFQYSFRINSSFLIWGQLIHQSFTFFRHLEHRKWKKNLLVILSVNITFQIDKKLLNHLCIIKTNIYHHNKKRKSISAKWASFYYKTHDYDLKCGNITARNYCQKYSPKTRRVSLLDNTTDLSETHVL